MDKYAQIKAAFEEKENKENADAMSKYMRNMFGFYGIPSPERKELYKDFLKSEKKSKTIDWDFLDRCCEDSHREFQYLLSDYLISMKRYVSYADIPKIEHYITTRPWWDTTDFLCKVIGDTGLRDPRVGDLMLEWSADDNMWKRRTAIEHQLGLKEKTDPTLLERIIVNSFGTHEFFINKAVGWALRDFSKTDPRWVRDFLDRHKDRMDSLSIKEAGKYV